MTNKKNSNKEIILNENLDVALGQRYLEYALSTITDRALPDSRDGLKPVHRRILYAMRQLKLAPSGSFRKCAKIVGEVMGNFHPHGDKAIYDSLVRMAQTFTTRYPLIEGQGNFGNIDGDNAAAQRYTEARLSEISMIMLDGLDESAVDFKDIVSANNAKQWLDSHGIVKANKNTIDDNVTIPVDKSAFTAGTIKVSNGKTVTINGIWRII